MTYHYKNLTLIILMHFSHPIPTLSKSQLPDPYVDSTFPLLSLLQYAGTIVHIRGKAGRGSQQTTVNIQASVHPKEENKKKELYLLLLFNPEGFNIHVNEEQVGVWYLAPGCLHVAYGHWGIDSAGSGTP
jgi:hypothetical protein